MLDITSDCLMLDIWPLGSALRTPFTQDVHFARKAKDLSMLLGALGGSSKAFGTLLKRAHREGDKRERERARCDLRQQQKRA